MKKALRVLFSTTVFLLLVFAANAQIQFQDTYERDAGNFVVTMNVTGNDGAGHNTYTGTGSVVGGTTAYKILFTGGRWEIQFFNGGIFQTAYYNTTNTTPNPPAIGNGTWVDVGPDHLLQLAGTVVGGLSNDATLSALTISTGTLTPSFTSATIAYTASVSNATASINVAATRNQANATIKINGNTVTSGSATPVTLSVGSNSIAVLVTAQDGTTKTYTITVTRAQPVTAAPVAVTPANGSLLNTRTPTYTGTSPGSATINVYVDGSSIGTTTAAVGGNWSLIQPINLVDGPHTIYATAQVSGSTVSANSNTNSFNIDATRPTVSITSSTVASGGTTSTSIIPFTVTFSQAVTGFVIGGITPTNASLSTFAGSGATYTFNAIPTSNGAVTINIAADVAQDAATNGNTAALQYAFTFTPVATAPTATTGGNTPSYITATLAGTVNDNNANTTVTFDWGLSNAYGSNINATPNLISSGTGSTAVTGSLSALTPGTTYFYRVKAVNSAGTTNGTEGSFTTLALPTVSTDAVTGVSTASAIMGGNVTAAGGSAVTDRGIVYAIGHIPTIADTKVLTGSSTGTFSGTINGLASSTLYHVRAYATNGGGTSYGADQPFTTSTAAGIISAPANFSAALSTTYGTVSPATNVTVSGTGLSAGITVTPSSTANFEVSADGTAFGPSVIIGISGTVSGTVYVRLKADAPAGTNITGNVTLTSAGANSPTINILPSAVSKATLTYTANAISKVYGAALPALAGTVTGLVNSETIATATTGSITWITTATTNSSVGSYSVNGSGLSAANYNFIQAASNASALTVTPKTLTVSATGNNKVYDGTTTATVTLSDDRVTGDIFTESYASASFATATVGTGKPISVTGIAISGGASGNYTLGNTTTSTTANITVKAITITADVNSKTYGNVDPTLNFTATPALATGDSFSGSLSRAPGENIGTYVITQGSLTAGSNYTITFTAGTNFTINKRAVTVTASAGQSKIYGNADPALIYTVGAPGLAFADSFSGSLSRAAGENAGSYAITQGTLALSSNYTITFTPGSTFVINPKAVTVTASAQSKVYGSADPTFSYTYTGTLIGGDTFTGSLARTVGENIGTYAINQGTLALNGNYALTYNGADLTISKKTVTVTAAAKSKAYGDADPALTYTFAPALLTGDSFSGSLSRLPGENIGTYAINQGTLVLNANYILTYVGADLTIGKKTITVTAVAKSKAYGDADPVLTYTFAPALAGTDTFSGSLSRLPGENIGTYAINQGTLALNPNYILTYVGADLIIGKKTITVTAVAKSKAYGDTDPAFTYTFAPALAGTDIFSGSLTRTVGESIGTYAINQGTLALNSNYTLTYIGADLTIGKKTVTVTAVAKSKAYGDADPVLTYTFAPALVGTDTFSGSLTRTVGENIGTYAINQGTLGLNANYILTYVGADLTIGKKTVTVTAVAKNKAYGDADPALTYTFAPALVGTDTFSGSLSRLPGENIGTYAISQGTLVLNGNYTLTYIGADLTIGKKTVTVTAVAKSKSYGDADPALTYTFVPALIGTDTFSGSLSRLPGENIGNYAINQGTLALNSNYTLTYIGAHLTIGKKTVTVTAAAKSKAYGDTDPAFTYTFSPALVGTDVFGGSLTRAVGENIGTYAINQGTLALNANYILTYVGADLIIGKKTITVTAVAKSKAYGDTDPAFTYTFAPALLTGDSFSGSLSRLPGENIGTYAINQGTLALNANYTLSYVGAALTIGKKTVTVTAAAKSKSYGDADPALSYTFAPALAGTDTFSGSLTRAVGENIGTYTINQGTLALNTNYTVTYVGADLIIGKKTVTVTAVAKSKAYGDADPAFTYTFAPALAGTDTFSGSLTRAVGENIGTYAINQGTLALNANYTLTYVGAALTIGKKTVTVTAVAKSKSYGDADPALTYTFAPALSGTDIFTGSLTRTVGENVGTYAINQGTLSLNGNYTLTYIGADLTIGKKTVTVTAAAKSKSYGDADPAFTYTFAPVLVGTDSFSGSLSRLPGENVGTYAINQGTLALSGNYAITYAGANLTVNKAVLTVSANNAIMCQSDGFPAFAVSYIGFKAGDTENALSTKPAVSTTANRNVAGTYVLVPSNGASNNYSFVYVNGTLTINALPSVNITSSKGTEISKGETAILTASGGTTYSWSTASGIISGQNTASLTVRPAQTTTYTVRVTNAGGCVSSASVTITVAEDYKLIATNILTPNGDGVNDTWTIQNIDMYPNNEMRIFDRGGREMYGKKGYDNSWNGTSRGIDLAEGTYYYIITYGPGKLVQKGFITIIRNR
jgi:gliding motility-associated-like protein